MTLLDMTSLDTTWLVTFLGALGTKALAQIPWALGLAAFFTILSLFPNQACNPNKPWWRNPGLLTDTHYLFFIPIFMRSIRVGLIRLPPLSNIE